MKLHERVLAAVATTLATAWLGTATTSGLAQVPTDPLVEPAVYRIVAHLGSAPEGRKIVGRLTLGAGARSRAIEVVRTQGPSGALLGDLFRNQTLFEPDYRVVGAPELLDRIFDGPSGHAVTLLVRARAGSALMTLLGVELREAEANG